MARARNIKPGFFTNEDLVELDFATRLLFAGLWTVADRSGRLEDRPKKIKMAVFPADDVDVDAMLLALHQARFITRYEVAGIRYIQVNTWDRHQSPHHTEKASVIPPINGDVTVKQPLENEEDQNEDGGNPPDSLIPDSLIPDSPTSVVPAAPVKRGRKATPRHLLPDDFVPNEPGIARAKECGLDVPAELRRFRDNHTAKGNLMADWQAAWRTWINNAVEYGRGKKPAKTDWATLAGFDSVYEAENAGCRQSNAHLFHNGKRDGVPA